ncbi:MAG: hypothetical protein EBU08_09470 [Micrococcales bacterium]|nr:hypothetical protein [Micrococcales bacterium]NBT47696.1 hypothetical protein [Actinomycetota bacterium]
MKNFIELNVADEFVLRFYKEPIGNDQNVYVLRVTEEIIKLIQDDLDACVKRQNGALQTH